MDRRAFLSAAACCAVTASAQLARAQQATPFDEAARYSADHGGVSFLVARYGIILAEHYAQGAESTRWPIGAGTRAFLPLLAATMVEDRLMTLDEPVALTIGDWGAHPVKSMISIRVLLSGASGIAFDRTGPRDLATAIALEPREAPGVRFSSDEAAYLIFCEVARRKLVQRGRYSDPARYLTERTLLPIGCVPIGWARMPDGSARFDDGAAVSARGWAQAGELIRREGVWRAQQLADDGTLREALRGSFAESRAGIGLWLATPPRYGAPALDVDSDLWRASSPAPTDLAMAAGAAGQRLYLSPSQGLVIVRQADPSARAPWSDAEFLRQVWRSL